MDIDKIIKNQVEIDKHNVDIDKIIKNKVEIDKHKVDIDKIIKNHVDIDKIIKDRVEVLRFLRGEVLRSLRWKCCGLLGMK